MTGIVCRGYFQTLARWLPRRTQWDQRRSLSVHEFVSYTILKEYGIPVPKFGVAKTAKEAASIARGLDTKDLIVKAQVLTGGRGKGEFETGFKGGVHPVKSADEAEIVAEQMLGHVLTTVQTGKVGKICNAVMIAERKTAKNEFYLAIMMERSFQGPVLISSSEGGVEIELVAASKPQAINYNKIDIVQGLTNAEALEVAEKIGLGPHKDKIGDIIMKLYDLFIKSDATLVEINPFIQDHQGGFYCLDAKLNFDDNAEFKQKKIFSFRDFTQEDEREVRAAKQNLNYISLDGSIGCMVNGAGLAMATMDIIKLSGGFPANFLDVGGGAQTEQVKEAFKIITTDPNVKAILVNIFGGIMRCDIIAEGIIAAATELQLKVPVVCRLQGTNVREGKELIAQSGLKIMNADDLSKAAIMAVRLAEIVEIAREINVQVEFRPCTSAQ